MAVWPVICNRQWPPYKDASLNDTIEACINGTAIRTSEGGWLIQVTASNDFTVLIPYCLGNHFFKAGYLAINEGNV